MADNTNSNMSELVSILAKFEASGLEEDALDELVHDLASGIAADINNGGPEEQIRYLAINCGFRTTCNEIDDLIESHNRRNDGK